MSYHFTPTRKVVIKDRQYQVWVRTENWNPQTLLLGKQNRAAALQTVGSFPKE